MVVGLCALACGGPERANTVFGDGPRLGSPFAMERFTLTAQVPTRTDTLRDSAGQIFSLPYSFPSLTEAPVFAFTRAGNIAVVDSRNASVVLFDSSGREMHRGHVDSYSRARPTGILVLPGDSIAVWDSDLVKINVFDPNLHLERVEDFSRWKLSDRESFPVGRLDDGRWVWRVASRHWDVLSYFSDVMTFVEKPLLIAGRADDVPAEFFRLASRRGLAVNESFLETSYMRTWTPRSMLEVRIGAVCEHGAVILGPDSVRVLDVGGRVINLSSLPRQVDTIRSADRERLVGHRVPDSSSEKDIEDKIRAEVGKQLSTVKVLGRVPTIDFNGRLWFFRRDTMHLPLFTLDRVDAAGQPDAAFLYDAIGRSIQIGARSIAVFRQGPDETEIITATRFAKPFSMEGEGSLGRCSASFAY